MRPVVKIILIYLPKMKRQIYKIIFNCYLGNEEDWLGYIRLGLGWFG